MIRNIAAMIFVSLSGIGVSLALADLLPTGDFLMRERMRTEPGFYDQADQFCRGEVPGAACRMPGEAFDGGGEGRCERRMDALGRHVQLTCEVKPEFVIDRQLPKSPYQFSPTACWAWTHDPAFRERMAYLNARCELVPIAMDRFCLDKRPKDACTAEVVVQGKLQQVTGKCALDTEVFDFDPPRVMARSVLLCQSAQPVIHDIQPASPPDSGNAQRP